MVVLLALSIHFSPKYQVPDPEITKRSLPQDRSPIAEPLSEVDSQTAALVPPGRLSVYMVQELLARNKQNPQVRPNKANQLGKKVFCLSYPMRILKYPEL